MRCKNCGSQNDDNLYICQNCGSPLYEEDDTAIYEKGDAGDLEKTKIVPAIKNGNGKDGKPMSRKEAEAQAKKKKQTTALIIVLCVVLISIIAVIIGVVVGGNKKDEPTTTLTTATTKPQTTMTTTEPTTTTTTETTTTLATYAVSVSCSQGGEVEGDGTYTEGDLCRVIARTDDGFIFDGWYEDGKLVAVEEKYTFNVTKNTSLKAVFTEIETEPTEELE